MQKHFFLPHQKWPPRPYGVSGSWLTGHALIERKRRGAEYVVVTTCVGAGQHDAGLFEVY